MIETLQDVEARMARIREKNEHFREYGDGSYEMALEMDGYWTLDTIANGLRERIALVATGAAQEGSGYISTDTIPADATEGHGDASPGCPEL